MRVVDKLSSQSYNQFKVEEYVKSFWRENEIYKKIKKAETNRTAKFYFLDGPPYASAKSIHVGTGWNKVIKDIVLRYHRMKGYRVWDRPGFDTHGLPIEVKIEQALGVSTKKDIVEKIGVNRFVEECKKFVDENMRAMIEQFKEIGVFMDWENPYVTYTNDYIESGWWLIKKAHEKSLLYKDLKVVHWCPRCETTLADYEVSEYRDLEDPSIYVKLPIRGKNKEYLLIWTTTPWTLPANVFVMVHPDLDYVRVKVYNEVFILAKSRVEDVFKEAGIKSYEILEEFKGSELKDLEYDHPLEDLVPAQTVAKKFHKVVIAPEAVSAYEGTGLVHGAPGHGTIDYEIGLSIGAPVLSLVDERGFMTQEAGKYKQLYFRTEANEAILIDLKTRGVLLHAGKIVHRYPVCWRCKTPLVLRATEQWYIAVTKLKDELIKAADETEWVPSWAKTRFVNLLKELKDWVISRQRFWGIPIPIWVCKSCKHIEVIGSVEELRSLGGEPPRDLHRPWIDQVKLRCPKCGGVMERVPDVLDVWFDSGIAFYASLGYPMKKEVYESFEPVDFIVEGHDQIRGWFFSLLRSGVIAFGKSPYKRVLVHGFALDEQGREMHKSLGNYVDFEELIARCPRDVFRLWVASNTVWEDLKFSWRGLEQTQRDFSVFWNTFVFASTYMGLDGFDPEVVSLNDVAKHLEPEDLWLLSKLNKLIKEYRKSMESLEIHNAAKALRSFLIDDVSRFYIRLIRRVWEESETPSKTAAYVTLYRALKTWLTLAAPFIPFFTEYVYQHFFREAEKGSPESVHMLEMVEPDEKLINEILEEDVEIVRRVAETALSARAQAGLKLRRPLRRAIVYTSSEKVKKAVEKLSDMIKELVNVKSVEVKSLSELEEAKIYDVRAIVSEIGKDYKSLAPQILKEFEIRKEELIESFKKKGYFEFLLGDKIVRLENRHVEIKASYPEWMSVSEGQDHVVAIDVRVSREEEMEGIAREVVRRVQFMRKELKLQVADNIELWINGDQELLSAVKEFEKYVMSETRAIAIHYIEPPQDVPSRTWDIDEKTLVIGVKRASS
ncbi:MAG: isoleucine--tRNA ligase [Acidilobaceae archaeon]